MLKDVFVNGNGGWVGVVARYGVATVIALGLALFLATKVDAGLIAIKGVVDGNSTKLDTSQTSLTSFIHQYEQTSQEMLKLARQTCINTSKTDEQRLNCLR